MKKYLLLLLVACIGICSSCKYDDSELWGSVDELANRVSALETLTQRMNGDISALQAVVTAVENQVSISEVEKLTDGYILHFTNGTTATIKNGTDGKDGIDGEDGKDGANGEDGKDGTDGEDGKDGADGKDAPYIYIAKENDVYYWTITVGGKTNWLTDEAGNKIPVSSVFGSLPSDGEDGKDGADGEDGKDGADGEDGKDGLPGRTPTLKINDKGDWMVSYDGTNFTKVVGSANAFAQKGQDGRTLFASVTESSDKSMIIIKMADGANTVYQIPVLQSLAFFLDEQRTGEAAKTKEMTWKSDSTEFVYYFTLNEKAYPKYEVMSEAFSDVKVDMTKKTVTLTLPASNPNPAGARAVILFYNNKQTLTSVFKFKNFLVSEGTNINGTNMVLSMLATTEETVLEMPALDTSGTDGNGGVVTLPVVQNANSEGSGTNTTLIVNQATTTDSAPLTFQQGNVGTQPGEAINNVTTTFSENIDNVKYDGPNTSFYLDGGRTLAKVEALTADATLHVRDITIENLIVKGGNIRIYKTGKITGYIKNESNKKVKIFLEEGAVLTAELLPDSSFFEIIMPQVVIKNKELAYALSKEYPNDVTLDKKGSAVMTRHFAASLTSIDFNFKGYTITSLDGIENFPNLTEFHCSGTKLKNADLSKNTSLVRVTLIDNELTSLDFSKNVNLKSLQCGLNNNLNTLNIKKCTQLVELRCGETALTSVDFHDITKIEELDYGYTKLSFNLNDFTSLKALGCYGHHFASLNLSSALKKRLVELQCYYCGITKLDLAEYPNLYMLNAHYNSLTSLDLSGAPELTYLNCHNNKMASLDITPLTKLQHLLCGEQHLKGPEQYDYMNLILTDNQAQQWKNEWTDPDFAYSMNDWVKLNVKGSSVEYVTISNVELSKALWKELGPEKVKMNSDSCAVMLKSDVLSINRLDFSWKGYTITTLAGIEAFENLTWLECAGTQLESCDLSKNTKLLQVNLAYNNLTAVDFSNNTALVNLRCDGNPELITLNIANCLNLTRVNFAGSSVKSIVIPNTKNIVELGYNPNKLTIDYKEFPSLVELCVSSSQLSTLDFIPDDVKSRLTTLNFAYNKISTLNLYAYPSLETLLCVDNNLSSLDLSGVKGLRTLDCKVNLLDTLDLTKVEKLSHLEAGEQKIDKILVLKLTDAQKEIWYNKWKDNGCNERVVLETPSGTGSGNDFGNGGIF